MPNTNILGAIGAQDSDYAFLHTYGQSIVYDALQQMLGNHNADLEMMESLLVDGSTADHLEKYKLPGTGRLQRRANQSVPATVKAAGEWAVGYPLEDFGASIEVDDIAWAYMTAKEFNRHVDTVFNQDVNTRRFEMLRALFNNAPRTFVDPRWPAITVQPLANGDATLYPPVVGSELNSARNNYLGVGTNATQFTNANNPLPAIVNALEQNFGTPTGGSEIVVLCNNAQTSSFQNLAGFDTVPNRFVTYGQNVSLVEGGFAPIPGRILGESDSALLAEWRWIPAGYLLAIHFGAPRPLKKRVDPPETGLSTGLQLVAADREYPFNDWSWRNRFGFGVGNRLNGVVMDLTATTANAYTIPAQYV